MDSWRKYIFYCCRILLLPILNSGLFLYLQKRVDSMNGTIYTCLWTLQNMFSLKIVLVNWILRGLTKKCQYDFFSCSYYFISFWFKQHQLSVPATPDWARPIVPRVGKEGMSSDVTDTILPMGGTASQMLLAPECLLHQWRNIIVALMHQAGWMASILL